MGNICYGEPYFLLKAVMKLKFFLTTLAFAVIAFLLTPVLWPDPVGTMAPTPAAWQIPLFIIFSVFEALAFGAGVSFLLWCRPDKGAPGLHRAAFLSVVWLLVSWWPHDNLHRIMPHGDFTWLLSLEYGFHVTLIIAGCVLARYVWTQSKK